MCSLFKKCVFTFTLINEKLNLKCYQKIKKNHNIEVDGIINQNKAITVSDIKYDVFYSASFFALIFLNIPFTYIKQNIFLHFFFFRELHMPGKSILTLKATQR